MNFVRIQEDEEDEVQYVHMEDPSAVEITFVRAPCPKKEVLYVGCSDLGMSFFCIYSSIVNNGIYVIWCGFEKKYSFLDPMPAFD